MPWPPGTRRQRKRVIDSPAATPGEANVAQSAWAAWLPVRATSAAKSLREFLTGMDTESLIDVADVVFHGLGAEEQSGGGFSRGLPAGKQQHDLELLRSG